MLPNAVAFVSQLFGEFDFETNGLVVGEAHVVRVEQVGHEGHAIVTDVALSAADARLMFFESLFRGVIGAAHIHAR